MIEGVEVGITIRQQPTGSYKVSVRTVTGVDASAICAHLGGGGHKQAAGCELLGSLAGITFDLYDLGIIFFDKTKIKQDYIVNF